jgi:hypothetical protein
MNSRLPEFERRPDIFDCCASRNGAGDLVYCLSDKRLSRDYCPSFWEAYFCLYPQNMVHKAGCGPYDVNLDASMNP